MGKLSRYGAIDRNNPEAAARCDRGGEIRKRSELQKEMMWAGDRLIWNGFLCCDRHRDRPNPQEKLHVLRPDPVPVRDPRPDLASTPIDYFVSDGIPGGGVTSGYVNDEHNRPLYTPLPDPAEIDDGNSEPLLDGDGDELTTGPLQNPRVRYPFA